MGHEASVSARMLISVGLFREMNNNCYFNSGIDDKRYATPKWISDENQWDNDKNKGTTLGFHETSYDRYDTIITP